MFTDMEIVIRPIAHTLGKLKREEEVLELILDLKKSRNDYFNWVE